MKFNDCARRFVYALGAEFMPPACRTDGAMRNAVAQQDLRVVREDKARLFVGQLLRALLSFVISHFFSPFGSRLWNFDANRRGIFCLKEGSHA